MVGCHRGQCPEIDKKVLINDISMVDAFRKLYQIKITEALDYDLVGFIDQKH